MYFTQEDYKKIQSWLQHNAIRDTEFSDANLPLEGSETITLVQKGYNVKTSLIDFIQELFSLGMKDFINITEKYKAQRISLSKAISLVPEKERCIGQVITFIDEDEQWRLYQFKNNLIENYNNTNYWIDLLQAIAAATNIVPDDEDTAGIASGDATVIKFKNKSYNPEEFSGLGRTYLRKNIVDGKNILTQEMINFSKTRYIIQYDYDLDGKEITIPEGCILDFQGGSFDNGTIIGTNSHINGTNCFRNLLKFDGTFDGLYKIDFTFDKFNNELFSFTSANAFGGIELDNEEHEINDTINITASHYIINGSGLYRIIYFESNRDVNKVLFNITSSVYKFELNNVCLHGRFDLTDGTDNKTTNKYGIAIHNEAQYRLFINNCEIGDFHIAIDAKILIYSTINNSRLMTCEFAFINNSSNDVSTTTKFNNCYFSLNERPVTLGESSIVDIHFNNCIFEASKHYVIKNYGGNSLICLNGCYTEANSFGPDFSGQILPTDETTYSIYVQDVRNDLAYEQNRLLVITNCIINGPNKNQYFGDVINIKAGIVKIKNTYISRFNNIITLNNDYKTNSTWRYNFDIDAAYFYGSDAPLFKNEEYLSNDYDLISINYKGNSSCIIRGTSPDLRKIFNNSYLEGFKNGLLLQYGYRGDKETNVIALKTDGKSRMTISENGVVFGEQDSNSSESSFLYNSIGVKDESSIAGAATAVNRANLNPNKNIAYAISISNNGLYLIHKYDDKYTSKCLAKYTTGSDDRPNCIFTDIGFCHFDASLGKPIWWTGDKWVDATGTNVDT